MSLKSSLAFWRIAGIAGIAGRAVIFGVISEVIFSITCLPFDNSCLLLVNYLPLVNSLR